MHVIYVIAIVMEMTEHVIDVLAMVMELMEIVIGSKL